MLWAGAGAGADAVSHKGEGDEGAGDGPGPTDRRCASGISALWPGAASGERKYTLEAAPLPVAITAPESLECECSLPCAEAPVPVTEELAPA